MQADFFSSLSICLFVILLVLMLVYILNACMPNAIWNIDFFGLFLFYSLLSVVFFSSLLLSKGNQIAFIYDGYVYIRHFDWFE